MGSVVDYAELTFLIIHRQTVNRALDHKTHSTPTVWHYVNIRLLSAWSIILPIIFNQWRHHEQNY